MFSFRRFWSYCWGTIAHPREVVAQVAREEKKVAYGFAAVMLLCILYSVAVFIGFTKGAVPGGYEPFLRIPVESYYFWQALFTTPVGLIGWILFAGAAQLLSRRVGGQGSFEDNLAVLGLPFILFLPLSWLPEQVMTFFPKWWDAPMWQASTPFRVGFSVAWLALVSIIGVRQVQKLSLARATLVVLVSLAPVIGVQMTYLH